jgi:hypothetical protein
LDLDEHALSEGQRNLKRLGITHVWHTDTATSSTVLAPSRPVHLEVHPDEQQVDITELSPATSPLPPVLRHLFHGKHCPVRTLWTYAGMHEDLLQADIPERLAFFRKIQDSVCTHLAWREEDISSWPLDQDPHLWAQGLAQLRPRIIVCFGDASRLTGTGTTELQVHCLPDLLQMAQGNRDLKNEAWRILRTLS